MYTPHLGSRKASWKPCDWVNQQQVSARSSANKPSVLFNNSLRTQNSGGTTATPGLPGCRGALRAALLRSSVVCVHQKNACALMFQPCSEHLGADRVPQLFRTLPVPPGVPGDRDTPGETYSRLPRRGRRVCARRWISFTCGG